MQKNGSLKHEVMVNAEGENSIDTPSTFTSVGKYGIPGLIIDKGLDEHGQSKLEEEEKILIAIECGSSTVKAVVLKEDGETVFGVYRHHNARVYQESAHLLDKVLKIFKKQIVINVGFSGSSGQAVSNVLKDFVDHELEKIYGPIDKENEVNLRYTSEVTAQTAPIIQKYGLKDKIAIIEIGGEDSKFVSINEKGAITKVILNGECAAGTGTFLEEQVPRIGYDNLFEMLEAAWTAIQNDSKPKNIAARCTVFTKSDISHQLRHENVHPSEVALSLVNAVARTYVFNLLGAMRKVISSKGPIIFQGGTAKNEILVRAFQDLLKKNKLDPKRLIIPEFPELKIAEGAAIFAGNQTNGKVINRKALDLGLKNLKHFIETRSVISHYENLKNYLKNPELYNKTWQPYNFIEGEVRDIFIGFDVGSTTSKVVILDAVNLNVLYKEYERTYGQPFEVVDSFIKNIGTQLSENINVLHVGITGSGREAMGAVVGADVVVDEINAHAFGVGHYYSGRLSVFEIGGQDSKYIEIHDGVVTDFAMNKVCAAGTGSFFDEIANERLKVPIPSLGEMGLRSDAPAALGQTCTVFMKSAIVRSQAEGYNKDDIAAGLAYAIANNYLTKVKENRRIQSKVIFQGGVANNLAVVAAFKAITGKEIIVPEQAEVMGAIGAALIAREEYITKHQEVSKVSADQKLNSKYLDNETRKLTFLQVNENERPQNSNGKEKKLNPSYKNIGDT